MNQIDILHFNINQIFTDNLFFFPARLLKECTGQDSHKVGTILSATNDLQPKLLENLLF